MRQTQPYLHSATSNLPKSEVLAGLPGRMPAAVPGERRRAARATVVSRVEERLAGVAHDARNLLSALTLYCDLLAGPGVLAPGFRHYARDLRRMGETGARLVERLAGEAATGARPFPPIRDLAAEVREMEHLLRALAGPEVRLEVDCAPCAGELGLNSEDLLRILFNLIANAAEAIHADQRIEAASRPPGFLRITVQRGGGASFLAEGGWGSVVLSVRDNGPGIAADDLPRIFEPGYTTHRFRERGEDASRGLGLAVVRQLVESAGGRVRAVSTPRFGSRFDLELPVLSAPEEDDIAEREPCFHFASSSPAGVAATSLPNRTPTPSTGGAANFKPSLALGPGPGEDPAALGGGPLVLPASPPRGPVAAGALSSPWGPKNKTHSRKERRVQC